MSLTALAIKSLKNKEGKPYTDYLDGNGLKVRVTRAGHKSYLYRYKINGKPFEYTIGAVDDLSLSDARKEHASLVSQVKAGRNPKLERDLKTQSVHAVPTVKDFAETYIQRYAKPKKKSWLEDDRQLKADVIPALGSLRIDAVKRAHVIALLDRKEDAGAMVARNRLLSLLSKYFAFALERGLVELNPVTGIKRLTEESRNRVLSDNEIKLFWHWLHSNKCDFATNSALKLALITGQRVDEVCSIREEHIQGDWWLLPDSKNSLPHTVFLCEMAKQIIDELRPHSRKGYLLINGKGAAKDSASLPKAMKESSIEWESEPKPTPHDLRRTCITGISCLGFSRLVQDKVANHIDSSVGGIYDRNDYAKEKQQAMEAWERKLSEIIHGQASSNVLTFRQA
ncbi:Integrase [Thiothrix eikelboomii]|uniref:Integrase n=1 Tax=Thiothrix eikelboomii TaxID=92487 RepID=A0A1T4XZ14_9GAMM|nr:site-specific integrase [Thiothrix eikelboomii]SKA94794.1 Integrase [Thiothrix eikelboomii]